MEFWGAEIKCGQSFDVVIGEGKVLHLSQACLGETKKETKESVCMHITIDGKKLVLGTLIPEKIPQQLFDLVFDKDFQVSHNSKNSSIYLYGYKADNPADDHGYPFLNQPSEDFSSEDDEEEELPLPVANGKQEAKKEEKKEVVPKKEQKSSAAGKQKVKIVEPEKDVKESDDDDDSDDSDAISEDSDDEDDEDSSDDEEDSDEEEETPKKEQSGKKRQNESASKTPSDKKKTKIAATPQKTEGKKGGAVHIATPHPSKQAVAKTPAGGSKSNQKSPATDGGAHSCKSCNRNFKTEGALSSHNQAKHSASK
ncbi:unnamed protein product [Lactuca saligna]|uniref:C2H2-type domain-containing protein n=1 Tax=Lactuca saligna TaxID=75948 RepID=A0AA35Y7G1_LACSI|nr:unnamed protein product [Lactuca saligna]